MASAGGRTLITDSPSVIFAGSAGKSQVTSQQPTVLHSTDGRTWTALSPRPADFSSSSIGNLSGHTVVLGNTSTGPAVATLGADGRCVVATVDAVLEPALNKNAASSLSTDGFRITAIGLPATQATGLRFNPSNRTLTLLDPKTGTQLAVFDINAANQSRVSVRTTQADLVGPAKDTEVPAEPLLCRVERLQPSRIRLGPFIRRTLLVHLRRRILR
jgi:hypothetical protein